VTREARSWSRWGQRPALRHGRERLEPRSLAGCRLPTSRSPHAAEEAESAEPSPQQQLFSCTAPGKSCSHGMYFFGLVSLLAHPYPCTHSYVFLRVPDGLSGQQRVILGLFELFWAVAVRHRGQVGAARLWFLLAEQRLGWGWRWLGQGRVEESSGMSAGVSQRRARGAAVARRAGRARVAVQRGGELGGGCWRGSCIPRERCSRSKGCGISCSRAAMLVTPQPDPAAILPTRDRGAVEKDVAG